MARTRETQILTPRKYCESLTVRMGHRPSYPQLAKLLSEAGFLTPKGNSRTGGPRRCESCFSVAMISSMGSGSQRRRGRLKLSTPCLGELKRTQPI